MRELIRLGADANMENDKGSTPLYWSVRYGLNDMARLLIVDGRYCEVGVCVDLR